MSALAPNCAAHAQGTVLPCANCNTARKRHDLLAWRGRMPHRARSASRAAAHAQPQT